MPHGVLARRPPGRVALLAPAGPTVWTEGNRNNQIGVPITVLHTTPETRFLALEMGATSEDLALTVHPHPTLSEGLMEAAEALLATLAADWPEREGAWASAQALVDTLQASFPPAADGGSNGNGRGGQRWLVFAGSSDKDLAGMFRALAPHFDHAFLTRYCDNPRSVSPLVRFGPKAWRSRRRARP